MQYTEVFCPKNGVPLTDHILAICLEYFKQELNILLMSRVSAWKVLCPRLIWY